MNRRTTLFSLVAAAFGVSSSRRATSNDAVNVDTELIEIATNPHSFMFAEQATDHVEGKAFIKIHSINVTPGRLPYVELRPGTVRYFRTNGDVAEDGQRAKISWSIGEESNVTNIGVPRSVVMVVRSLDGVISWYTMKRDRRC